MGSVTVIQADREAAASVAVLAEMRELILAGRADHHAEPFARHRVAAIEVAALVADPPLMHRKGNVGLWQQRRAAIAAQIRALAGPVQP